MRARSLAFALIAGILGTASIGHAHHISGTIYCDVDYDGQIDNPGDSKIGGLTVRAVSQDVNPGETFSAISDGTGFYNIGLPARTDHYLVSIVGLPGGLTIVLPAGGSHLVQIITGNSATDHKDNVDFLVQGCAPAPTTSSTSSSTSSSSSSSTSSSTSTSTSTVPTTSTTTLPGRCNCELAFFIGRDAKFNNDAEINATAAVNSVTGRVKLGRNVFMADGTALKANYVEIGNASSVYDVFATLLVKKGPGAIVRNGTFPLSLPIADPFCEILQQFTCGGDPVLLLPGETQALPPGTYGTIRVLNDATLQLSAGTYTVCDVKMGRQARIEATGAVTMQIDGSLRIGTASYYGPLAGSPIIDTYVTGPKVRISQSGMAVARIIAPFAKSTFGRDSSLSGCFCSDRSKSDKHITLSCQEQ